VTVALSGDGGDEIFAGYERFAAACLVRPYRHLPQPVRNGLERGLARLPRQRLRGRVGSAQRFVAAGGQEPLDAYLSWIDYFDAAQVRELAAQGPSGPSERGGSGADRAIQDYRAVWDESDGAALLDRLLNLNLRTYLLDDLLPKVDRTSMAHALEVRSPFLDTDLVEMALRLPPGTKTRGFSRKRVLGAAMADRLPASIIQRRKRGFGVPLNRWFREDLRGFVEGRLFGPSARISSHLDGSQVTELWESHQRGLADHGLQLWALLTLEVFLREQDW
jgi:asparagine synthase (glutamine-hydrolysing)